MKIVKMDRRFTHYHQGFTHQIRGMNFRERLEIEKFLRDQYGDNVVRIPGEPLGEYNRNWRLERARRSYTGGTKIYVKHERDLVMLGLKFNLTVQRA